MKKLEFEVARTDLKFEWKFGSIQLEKFLTIQFKFLQKIFWSKNIQQTNTSYKKISFLCNYVLV